MLLASGPQLDHPNVIKLVEYYEDSSASQMYLILEYCSGGELFDQLKAQPHDKFPEATAAVLVHQMLSAVAYCHKMGIAHRDLKVSPAAVLIGKAICATSRSDVPLRLLACPLRCWSAPQLIAARWPLPAL